METSRDTRFLICSTLSSRSLGLCILLAVPLPYHKTDGIDWFTTPYNTLQHFLPSLAVEMVTQGGVFYR